MALTSLKNCFLVPACLAFAVAAQAADEDIVAARDAAERGDVKALEAARDRTAGHLLESYPAYWLLIATLNRATSNDIRAFIAKYGDGPLADQLRREWLLGLGATQQWDLFRAEYPGLMQEDNEVTCYSFQQRLVHGDKDTLKEVRALWLGGREAPSSCTPPFEAAARDGLIGPAQTWERIRKLLLAGNVRDAVRANAFLGDKERMDEKALDRAKSDPARFLAAEKSRLTQRAGRELWLFAILRLARDRPEEAARHLEGGAKTLGADDARYGWGQIAHAAARQLHPRALEWYAKAGDGPFSDAQLQWKVRAALRAGDWAAVRSAVSFMSPVEARDPAWRYWLARAIAHEGDRAPAEAILKALAREDHFYGLLAAEDLGISASPDWTARSVTEEEVARVQAIPAVKRAIALYKLEMNTEAFREWVFGLRAMDDRGFLAASEVATQAGLADRAIAAAERTASLHDFTRRYPIPHREALAAAARQWNLDEALLYGIIRQESRFNSTARSRAGATGLMQLMPATARWVAKQLPVERYRPALLDQPEINVAMGTYYFHRVLANLGDPVLAMTGYNAGPGRAKRWRDDKPLEGAIYAESIPFNETRDYVKKVLANAWFYTHRLTGKTVSLRSLLGTVPGRLAEARAEAAPIP